MKIMIQCTVIVVCVALLSLQAYGDITVERSALKIAENTGLVIQDQDGFLWFGTNGSGLYRYDGINLKVYKAGPDSISDNYIFALYEDREGIIWIGTRNGLNQYDKKSNKFTIHRHDPNDINTIGHDVFAWGSRSICQDSQGDIWIGTMGGLNRFNKGTNKFVRYSHDPEKPDSLGHDHVYAVIEDRDGIIWVATHGGGLNRFDRAGESFARYIHDPDNVESLSDDRLMSLIEDRDGMIWVGTLTGGLNGFDKKNGKFRRYQHDPDDPGTISHDNVFSIFEDSSGLLWFGRYDVSPFGLESFDKNREKFQVHHHDPDNAESLSSDLIFGIFEDRSGIFWIVNLMESIDKVDKSRPKFDIYRHHPNNPHSISANQIVRVYEDSRGNIWTGPFGTGIDRYDPVSGKFTNYPPAHKDQRGMARYVPAIFEDSRGNFWLGNFGGTLSLFHVDSGRIIKTYEHEPGLAGSLVKHSQLNHIIEDVFNPDILWLAAYDGGLVKFNKSTEAFRQYDLSANQMWMIYQDDQGIIWIPTLGGGLDKFNPSTEDIINYKHHPKDPASLSANSINYVYQDKKDEILWVGSASGLDGFDKKSGRVVKRYTGENGYAIEGVMTIVGDNDNNLWMGTDSGLVKFNLLDETVKIYREGDGLPGNRFNFIGALKARDGKLWFGNYGGLVGFYPENIKDNRYVPPVVLTALTQGGEPIVADRAPEKIQEVVLDWQHNFFEFEYAALHFSQPEKCQYRYMLEGHDQGWFHAGNRRFGRYTKLPGGSYVLKIKGSNNDGIWNPQGTEVRVIVTPPFWKTGWFYLTALVSAMALMGFAVWYLVRLKFEINQRISAQKALSESEEKYKALIENAPDLRYRTDMEGRIVFISRSVSRLTGYTVQELMETQMADHYIDPVQREDFLSHLLKEGAVENYEAQLKRKDGSIWWASTNAAFYKDQEGGVLGVEGVTRDVTTLKRAQQEQLKAEQYAAKQDKHAMVGQIAGKLAHDFNNVLGVIMGNTELAIMDCREPAITQTLELIFDQTMRGKNLTRNMVAFARDQEPSHEFFQISEKIDLVLNLMKKDIEGIDVIREDEEEVPDLLADPGMIEHALVNMIQNSIHALSRSENPGIVIRTGCSSNMISFEIEDNGCGIPEEHIQNIYEPSFSLKGGRDITGSYKGMIHGTGYGMSNVEKYITQHKGTIDVESKLGYGTKFAVKLPVINKELTMEEKKEIQKSNLYFDKSILLVEDEQGISDVQQRILTGSPCCHRVDIASNGQMAMELFKRNSYDCVSLDYMLPGEMNGMDVYNFIRKSNNTVPILFVSGNIEFIESIGSLKKNDRYLDHLSKPSRNIDYVNRINKLLEGASITKKAL